MVLNSTISLLGVDSAEFDEIIQKAKADCSVSQMPNAEITLDYTLNN
nr:Peroxiredoxin OsmC [Candidatus Pantoea persica]